MTYTYIIFNRTIGTSVANRIYCCCFFFYIYCLRINNTLISYIIITTFPLYLQILPNHATKIKVIIPICISLSQKGRVLLLYYTNGFYFLCLCNIPLPLNTICCDVYNVIRMTTSPHHVLSVFCVKKIIYNIDNIQVGTTQYVKRVYILYYITI